MDYPSYFPNYYSLNDISVTQIRFKLDVEHNVKNLGFLDSDATSDLLEKGKTIEIPIFLLLELEKQLPYNNIKAPEAYSEIFKEICNADAFSVDIGKINKHYYEFGRYVALVDPNAGDNLSETFKQRAKLLVDLCKNLSKDVKMNAKFDQSELELYNIGCNNTAMLSKWLQKDSLNIETSKMVSNHRKRKRNAILLESRDH